MSTGKGRIKDALNLAGSEHKYQTIVILLISFTWIQINYLLLGPTLIYMNPIFECKSTGDQRIPQSQACPMIKECKLVDNFTITAELGLYCELQWARDTIQAIFSIGSFVGLIVMNTVSDTKGRRIAILIAFLVIFWGIISTFLGAFFHVILLIIIGQFFCGFGAYAMVTLCYTLLTDFFSDQLRSKAFVIINSVWGISTLMLGVFYLVSLNWIYYLLLVVLLPLVLVFAGFYVFLVESPYILFNQNKIEQVLFSLATIAIKNDRKQNIPEIKKIVYEQTRRDQTNEASLKNVLKTVRQWKYLKSIILLTIIYGIGAMNFYGIAYAMEAEGYGYGYNSLISGCVQMVSFVYLNFTINNLPRRKGIAVFYIISLILGLSFIFSWVSQDQLVSTIMLALGRITGTVAYTMIACLQMESFTVQIQSTASGLIEAFSLFGVFLAPLAVDLADKIGVDPVAFIAILLNFAIWPNMFIRETLVRESDKKKNPLLQDLNQKQNQISRQAILTKNSQTQQQSASQT